MSLPSFVWAFEINPSFPIIRVYGISEKQTSQHFAMILALDFIDKAQKFQGIVIPDHEIPQNKQVPLMVSFTLKFNTHRDIHDYINCIKNQS